MIFVLLVELGLAVAFLYVVATQVVTPALQGTPLFPALRRPSRADLIARELKRINEEGMAQAMEDEFQARRAALARHRASMEKAAKTETKGEQDEQV